MSGKVLIQSTDDTKEYPKENVLWDPFHFIQRKNMLPFEIFETKGEGGAAIFSCFEETKYERFIFCKHP